MTIRKVLALVHYPCLNKAGELYSTSIFNVDVHDIARVARTYDFDQYALVHPVEAQRDMAQSIANFWASEKSKKRNPDRASAISLIQVIDSLESLVGQLEDEYSAPVLTIATSAIANPKNTAWSDWRTTMNSKIENGDSETHLYIFGTGHGLAPSVTETSAIFLEPILGATNYNHLSVRAAVAIACDRLFSPNSQVGMGG